MLFFPAILLQVLAEIFANDRFVAFDGSGRSTGSLLVLSAVFSMLLCVACLFPLINVWDAPKLLTLIRINRRGSVFNILKIFIKYINLFGGIPVVADQLKGMKRIE
ncbi:hypothetical protein HMPREF0766_12965 [Sphingobacterium spiritivorum ATCC 33861]|uniref:Uncharacterized protein n=1 Tax=Sphingobacterium spiritivorum ATCC 33861 TaxID=525373 RepID=D7VPP5_SPHSI|nr:hypothetical protein HMPREF0766_12965 [Sphingobacterium spiritivorum ATCC 33861]